MWTGPIAVHVASSVASPRSVNWGPPGVGSALASDLVSLRDLGEPGWQPITMLPTIAALIDGILVDACEHYETLLGARPRPYVLRARRHVRLSHLSPTPCSAVRAHSAQLGVYGRTSTGSRPVASILWRWPQPRSVDPWS